MSKSKMIKILIGSVLGVALVFGTFLATQSGKRVLKEWEISRKINKCYKTGEMPVVYLHEYNWSYRNERKLEKFVVKKIENMVEKGNVEVIVEFFDSAGGLDYLKCHEEIREALKTNLDKISIEKKIELISKISEIEDGYTYQLLEIDDVKEYIDKFGEESIILENGQGGYYDNLENRHSGGFSAGVGASYSYSGYGYYGDFEEENVSGKSAPNYEEAIDTYSHKIWFKGNYVENLYSIPEENHCWYSEPYLFVQDDDEIEVYTVLIVD